MPQEITAQTAPATIQAKLREFIYMDADGSQRVNSANLAQYLVDQFSYVTGGGVAPTTKQAQAQAIANTLASAIGREAFAGNPAYPSAPAGGSSEATKAALIELRTQMYRQVQAATDPFREFDALLATRVRSMFNTMVLPSFPAGIKLLETTRAYIETFVTDRGEESAPSPVSNLHTLDQNDTTTVQCNDAPPGRHITHRRLYRSATGTTQSAFRLQGEYPISEKFITDDKLDEHLNEPCPTFGWLEPPAGLKGLVGMPNGMMLGYVGRTLHACEPYHSYAYPAKYDKPLAHDITGLVAFGQSAFVGTTGRPYIVSGSDAASLSEQLISSGMPCMSARSMVAIGNAVLYAAPDGLALYENGSVSIVTSSVFDRAAWREYRPQTMRAGEYDGRYIAFYTKADGATGALVFDYQSKTMAELDQQADAVFSSEDGLFVLDGANIHNLFPTSGSNRAGSWHSKEFRLVKPQGFAWIQVDSDFRNRLLPASCTLTIYADDVLHQVVTIDSRAPVRCKAGKATNWRIEVDSNARIEGIVLATTTEELKAAL